MTAEQIKSRSDKARQRLNVHDERRKVIEAELLAIQHACPHEHVETWNYGSGSDCYWQCVDCGLMRVR